MSPHSATFRIRDTVINLIVGNIADQDTDAVVNAANPKLSGGGGVDGAIHSRGGPQILEECKDIRKTLWPDGLPAGKAVMTGGGKLRARYVIHTVGPIWMGGSGDEAELLRNAYINSLDIAVKNHLKSISFPSIGTGAYGYPIEKASRVVLQTLKEYLAVPAGLDEVRLVLFKQSDLNVYIKAAKELS